VEGQCGNHIGADVWRKQGLMCGDVGVIAIATLGGL